MEEKVMWMAVTADEYELPLTFGYSLRDIGRKLGIANSTVSKMVTNHCRSKYTFCDEHYRIVKVKVEKCT